MNTPAPEWLTPPLQPDPEPAPRKRGRVRWIVAGVATLAVLAGAGIALAVLLQDSNDSPSSSASDRFADVKNYCAANDSYVEVTDGGKTLLLETRGKEDSGTTMQTLACVLTRLGMPQAVVAKMEGTTALQGRQDATWDGFKASWTYHPDNGLDLIVQTAA